ncbi:PAS domain-containing protein [Methanosarcina sp. KYL-1]|uniref:histidine kinase N-terminal 7TM domain-containing protein n=1 Tax=Methanosarcina sp. KYL-1 TaxID=2602068 RepID=UPI0021007A04|nr:histidine kinase N-terminal 7TM domain-containing protein [Methanosarcina sp. KYL-1]MCQ1536103.1 PAS domain-containing protein [Methanosarcina sp. KYL-1]
MEALVFSAFVSLLLAYKAYLTFDYRRVRFARYFILLMLCMAEWTVFYAGEIGFIGADAKFLCTRLSYPGNALLSVLWFLFAAEYCDTGRNFIRRFEKFFFIEPVLSVLAVATNSLHWLYYSGYTIETFGGIPIILFEHGPLFRVLYVYSFSLSMLGIFFFVRRFISASPALKPQLGVLTTGALLPILGNLLYVKDIGPFAFIDPTAFSFAFGGLIFLWGTGKHEFLNLVPIARENVIDTMNDGYIVVDADGSIADINNAALELIGKSRKSALGNSLNGVFGRHDDFFSDQWQEGSFSGEISINKGSKAMFFNVNVSPVLFENRVEGRLIMIRDVTEAYLYREALEQVNRKINLMSSITRHDILNQVNVLSGYTELLSEMLPPDVKKDLRLEGYLKNLKKCIETIHSQSIFTRDYQDLGVVAPVWQSVRNMAIDAASSFSNAGVEFFIQEGDMEVHADPLFQKAFHNLLDSALSHGKNVSRISVSFRENGEKAVIEVLDNGVGVPSEMKESIFEKSAENNTGLGLFFMKDVSSITGMEIKETGIEGEGARFEITVPPGNWRLAGPDTEIEPGSWF